MTILRFQLFLLLSILSILDPINTKVSIRDTFPLKEFHKARQRLQGIAYHTPLQYSQSLSEKFDCNVFVKREDLQIVRSYKIRGAYNKMSTTSRELLDKGVVAASAGNHAQGVAFSCNRLKVHCKIFMPSQTPLQKVNKVRNFGKEWVEIILSGINFDEAFKFADEYTQKTGSTFVHPFDDIKVITGQGTAALEILEDADLPIDYVFAAIGGGGFLSGVSAVFSQYSPETKLIGVEPTGAASMKASFDAGKRVKLEKMDAFVDGAAVGYPGALTFDILTQILTEILVIPEGKVCTTILELYNDEGIIAEPAGALSIAALDGYRENIRGKTIVVVISGGNNDINRSEEIKRRSKEYEETQKTN